MCLSQCCACMCCCLRGIKFTVKKNTIYMTVKPRFTNAPVHEQTFRPKTSRMTNGVSDYEHASWQQQQAENIGAGVSVAG
jgi:hypothetical protein